MQRPRAQFVTSGTDSSGSSTIREDLGSGAGAAGKEDNNNQQQYGSALGSAAAGGVGGSAGGTGAGGAGGLRGGRASQFAPVNSLASATRIINHHLFGTIASSKHNTGN